MGPSWYWMPDVFEKFYNQFGYTTSDLYELKQLDPGFQVIFKDQSTINIPASWERTIELFENIEHGSSEKLIKFMEDAELKYKISMNDLVYQPGLLLGELINSDNIKWFFKLNLFSSFSKHVRKYFKDERLIAIMEFPVLFLGAKPQQTPALYSLMNYSGIKQGTFYPMGGFSKVVEAMVRIAKEQGVEFKLNEPVNAIQDLHDDVKITTVTGWDTYQGVVAAADYKHVESLITNVTDRNYNDKYWSNKVLAPSCLIFYLGVNKKVPKLEHHNLFFDEDLDEHARQIYDTPKWPTKPLFYVCCPSKTDPSVAPQGKENLFILMPIAPGLVDENELREQYYSKLLTRLERFTGVEIKSDVCYKRSYCVKDFINDYNSYKGNAYGLANTLSQTANLKPKIRNRHIKNLYYAGQLTVPGPGVPPSLISGQLAAEQLIKNLNYYHETIVR